MIWTWRCRAWRHDYLPQKPEVGFGGELDVDRNFGTIENSPIENVFWEAPPRGEYTIVVSLYERRATSRGRPIDATVQIRKGNDVEVKSYSLNGENQDAVLTVNFSYP